MKNLFLEIRNTPIFNKQRVFYITKYSAIIVLLLIFALFSSNVFSFANFLGFLFLLCFIFSIDLMIIFLKNGHKNKKITSNDKEIKLHEKILFFAQLVGFVLCANDIMPYIFKSLLGLSVVIVTTYFALEMIRKQSDNPALKGRKYVKYAPFILLPTILVNPFPLIFMIIYYVVYLIMIPGIIILMIYMAVELMSKIKLPILISSFVSLYGFLMLCL